MIINPINRLQAIRRPISRTLNASAWFFILMSGVMLGGAGLQLLANPAETASLLQGTTAGKSVDAVGLSYQGWDGLGHITLQLVALALAVGLTILPARSARALRRRRIGHLGLVAWATLWLGNVLYLAGTAPDVDTVSQTAILSLCFLGTATRALGACRAPQRATSPEAQPVEAAEPDATEDLQPQTPDPQLMAFHIAASDKIQEVPVPGRIAQARLHGGKLINRGCAACSAVRNQIPQARERATTLAARAGHHGRRLLISSRSLARATARVARRTARQVDDILHDQGVIARTESAPPPERTS